MGGWLCPERLCGSAARAHFLIFFFGIQLLHTSLVVLEVGIENENENGTDFVLHVACLHGMHDVKCWRSCVCFVQSAVWDVRLLYVFSM